jgi:hypothetical protein
MIKQAPCSKKITAMMRMHKGFNSFFTIYSMKGPLHNMLKTDTLYHIANTYIKPNKPNTL